MIAAAGLALVATPLALVPTSAQAAGPVTINLLNINDFHGRIDANTVGFAGTVEKLRAAATGASQETVLLSAGDNIGASLFASASADDNPTLDVLDALELKASAVGNHEFDKGVADLTGHVADRADFPYLGANVYQKGTQTPALDEYAIIDVAGLKLGVIGAVTQQTPSLVSPGGITSVDFGDPVAAVNRVAAALSDGNAANGEADVLVAEYHDGAGAGTPEGATLEQEVAAGGAFADIVTKTAGEVDAIFTGHTHKQYAWSAAKPGGGTRPVVQTGSYGANIGQITLTVDTDNAFAVTAHTQANVKRLAPVDTNANKRIDSAEQVAFDNEMTSTYPRAATVKTIVDQAVAAASVIGRVPVGTVSRDVTTAWKTGSHVNGVFASDDPSQRDDRSSESTLGNLVANALRDSLSTERLGSAEIGVVNPGGLRNELLYAGTGNPDTDKDGVITYAEANAVLPFVNNLWTVSLTGAKFKELLEQQWQTDKDGKVITSAPFLHLGLSDNVSVTRDETKPLGQRITSVLIDGAPLDVAKSYRIGTFSFLAEGGDNFRAFQSATDIKDTGLIDRDVWIEYLQGHKPVGPSFARRQVESSGIPARVVARQRVAFTLSELDLTSLGSPANRTVSVSLRRLNGTGESVFVGTYPVTEGAAKVAFRVPAELRGWYTVTAVARPSGTTVGLPVLRHSSTVRARVAKAASAGGAVLIARVEAGGFQTDGKVRVFRAGRFVGAADVVNGRARLLIDHFASGGRTSLVVRYTGGSEAKPSVTRVHAIPAMRLTLRPRPILVDQTHARVLVRLTAPVFPVRGWVVARTGGQVVDLEQLSRGRAVLRLPAFDSTGPKRVVVRYFGSDVARPVTKVFTVRVRR